MWGMNVCKEWMGARVFLRVIAAVALACISARAEEPTQGVDLALVSSVRSVSPSATFTVGLTIHHHPGFHTYWKNPGAVGYPIQMKWELPEGFTAGEVRWPVPEMSSMAGHPVFGYVRDVTLLVDLTAPAELPEGELEFHADVSWMACSNACHPDNRRFTVTLPVADETVAKEEVKELFAKAEESIPLPLEGWSATLESGVDGKQIVFQVTPPAGLADPGALRVYSYDGQISSDPEPVITKQEEGTYRIEVPRADFSPKGEGSLPFVLVGENAIEEGGKTFGFLEPEYAGE
jgi:DsbC/DsbD-like thiol-disulfide interchange protein